MLYLCSVVFSAMSLVNVSVLGIKQKNPYYKLRNQYKFSTNSTPDPSCIQRQIILRWSKHSTRSRVLQITIREGNCLSINCISRRPARVIMWLRNSTELNKQMSKSKGHSEIGSLRMSIINIAPKDAGFYKCEGLYRRGGRANRIVQLLVHHKGNRCLRRSINVYKARVRTPYRLVAKEGDCVVVTCISSDSATVHINHIPKVRYHEDSSSLISHSGTSLELNNVSKRDSGVFECKASLKRNRTSYTRRLHIIVLAKETMSSCGTNLFRCHSSQCVDMQFHCDRYKDCPDGSDELGCPDACRDKFQCTNGRCIDKALVCNHFDNCRDRSDEYICITKSSDYAVIKSLDKPSTPYVISDAPWLNATVHSVIGITIGIVIFSAGVVVFIYRHKIRQTRDIRRRIATVRRVRCAIQNDYQPPPMNLTELNPFLDETFVSDYGFTSGNIFLNVNSVHYSAPNNSCSPPSYSDVENCRGVATPPPPYENNDGTSNASTGNTRNRVGRSAQQQRPRSENRGESHDYVNVSQQVCPLDLGASNADQCCHSCQPDHSNTSPLPEQDWPNNHDYVNVAKSLGSIEGDLDATKTTNDYTDEPADVVAMDDVSDGSVSTTTNSNITRLAACSRESFGFSTSNDYTDFPGIDVYSNEKDPDFNLDSRDHNTLSNSQDNSNIIGPIRSNESSELPISLNSVFVNVQSDSEETVTEDVLRLNSTILRIDKDRDKTHSSLPYLQSFKPSKTFNSMELKHSLSFEKLMRDSIVNQPQDACKAPKISCCTSSLCNNFNRSKTLPRQEKHRVNDAACTNLFTFSSPTIDPSLSASMCSNGADSSRRMCPESITASWDDDKALVGSIVSNKSDNLSLSDTDSLNGRSIVYKESVV